MIKFSQQALRLMPSAIRNKAFNAPDIIRFSAGQPAPELFPIAEIADLMPALLLDSGPAALQYAATEGCHALREIIADRYMPTCGVTARTGDILLTAGSQEGLEMSARLFINPGDAIICENPSYTGAFGAFAPYGPRYVPVSVDDNGMCMDALEMALKANADVKMIYTIPDFHNPTGITMSLARRRQLAELAAQYQVPVIEDRPYGDLAFDAEPLPAVKSFDREGWVVMLGSFSKILCPGLRLAWLCAAPALMEKYALVKGGATLQCGTLDQYIVLEYLRRYDLTTHIEELKALYRSRRNVMLKCLKEFFPAAVRFTSPQGGFFIWVELPLTIDTNALLPEALERAKTAFVPGAPFWVSGRPHNFLRLSYSNVTETEIETGLKRLGELVKAKCAARKL